ncbi:hypothetical protein NMU03_03455 [Allocoprobacillus halotolerans]|uniref:Uncharacterized protein n=1 Tax=Allocoprobacillus halotolerans TaxID=2944914 RepID=A0ABY5I485_9FIRM|nr:hypothetical protein [Allocoprobacillus halotolerans]UTY39875.1 hypothetical protein NMU03_03455 [Allocoprobacillus halotolerans]
MNTLKIITKQIVKCSQDILGDNLVGDVFVVQQLWVVLTIKQVILI